MKQDIFLLIEHIQGQVSDISYTLIAAGRKIAEDLGCSLAPMLLGFNEQGLAIDLAVNRVLYFNHSDLAYFNPIGSQQVISAMIQENKPRLVLFGDTSMGADIAGALSVQLNLPLVSYCRNLKVIDGNLQFTSQICGGKIMIEGFIPNETTLVMMIPGEYKIEQGFSKQPPVVVWADVPQLKIPAIKFKQYITPEISDIDISKEKFLVSVGRGIENQDNIGMVEELAQALGGVVCASRPVVDQGWLPTTRLVGKSGKRVKPKVYLALGISGAPEHVEAITDSDIIIAINTDPTAPIFNQAKYGSTLDLFDLVPALKEALQRARHSVKA